MSDFLSGETWTALNPSGTDPAINSASTWNVTYDIAGLANINPSFSNSQGLYLNFTAKAGQNAYSPGTQAKRTFIPLHIRATYHAAGQKLISVVAIDAYGMGDTFISSERLTYAGGPISGDEGQGFTPVNYLAQQAVLTRPTISSIAAQSLANTTTTQAIVKSQTPQAVSVASASGISVNDWVVVGQEVPMGPINIEAVKITAVGAGTITGIFTSNNAIGATITPALVMVLSSGGALGEQRVLVNLSGASYSTGSIASKSGGALLGSGTSWAENMVGGTALNIGAISVTGDDYSGVPFSASKPCKSWFQVKAVTNGGSLGVHSYSCAGDISYRGTGFGPYVIRPAARILRVHGSLVICESSAHTWTVGDTLECAICPYPDVSGFQYRFTAYTRGGTYRRAVIYHNDGARAFSSCIEISGIQNGANGSDIYGWDTGVRFRSCNYGMVFDDVKTAAIFLRSSAAGSPDANGTILWNSVNTYLKPGSNGGLIFRPFYSGAGTVGAVEYKGAALTADGLYHVEHDCAVISSKYIKPGSYTVANAPSAVNTGAGSIIYCTNGNAGAACLAVSNGTSWKVVPLGATISVS